VENLGDFRLSVPYMLHASGNLPLLDMRFSYSAGEAYQLFDALGPLGRHDYARLFQSVDVIIPLVFSWFLWSALSRGAFRRYRFLGLLGGAFDYLENVAVFILLASYPVHLNSVVFAAEMFTRLKFIGYGSGLLLAAFGFAIELRAIPPQPAARDGGMNEYEICSFAFLNDQPASRGRLELRPADSARGEDRNSRTKQ